MWNWLRVHWRNGLRFQLAISLLILGGIIALYLQFYNFANRDTGSEITIESVRVFDPPIRDTIVWQQVICNDSDAAVSVSISVRIVTAAPPEDEQAIPGQLTTTAVPGCHPGPERVAMVPASITPGQWKLRVVDTTAEGGLIRFTSKDSEPFEVIEGDEGGE